MGNDHGLPTGRGYAESRRGRPVLGSPPMASLSRARDRRRGPPRPAGGRRPAPVCLLAPLSRRWIARLRAWPRPPSGSTSATGWTSWSWPLRPATPPRPGAASRPTPPDRREPSLPRCAVSRPEDWGRSAPSIPGRTPGLVRSWRRWSGWASTAGMGDAPVLVALPAPSPWRRAWPAAGSPLTSATRPDAVRRRLAGPRRDPDPVRRPLPRRGSGRRASTRCRRRRARVRDVDLRRAPGAPRPGGGGRPRRPGGAANRPRRRRRGPSGASRPRPGRRRGLRRQAPTSRRSPTVTRGCRVRGAGRARSQDPP